MGSQTPVEGAITTRGCCGADTSRAKGDLIHSSRGSLGVTWLVTLTANWFTDMNLVYGMANCNRREALRMYRQKNPSRNMPSRSFFATIHRRLCETGSLDVHKPDSGRQRISRTVDAEERVVHALQRNPSTSIRVVSRETHIPQTIVWRIVHDEGLYPYHLQRVRALQPGD
ncbi:uncharacterized protein TNCT_105221 [Trichonephila clavata]|uniref:DUF4817 domain-containing protein n=1 Tax=Trichonephila clavata TaxID=2740835 RepID=A0A8X6HCR7_TRICU|nr:uncharacterized protein TNCT_105221 [Trichonephila clavata]